MLFIGVVVIKPCLKSPFSVSLPLKDIRIGKDFARGTGVRRIRLILAQFGTLVIAALLLASSQASAATTITTTFSVTATVVATCIVSAVPLPFGNYTGLVDSVTSTVTVQCTNTTPYTIGLSAGSGTGATETTRKMLNGAILLPYGLFTDSGHLTNWGNITGTWVSGTGNGNPQLLTVYGQITAGNYVTPGSYVDTITATVTY